MTQINRSRRPGASRLQAADNLSIGVNLAFQSALRGFLEAQKPLSSTGVIEAEYAEQERHADAATTDLIRTIDEFIERRKRIEKERKSEKMKGNAIKTRPGLQVSGDFLPPTAQYVAISARLQLLMARRGLDNEKTRRRAAERTPQENVTYLLRVLSVGVACGHVPSLKQSVDLNSDLARMLTRGGTEMRTVERARQLLIRLVWNGCLKRHELTFQND